MIKWTEQEGVGPVMICTTYEQAIQEMNVAGCVDVTVDVYDQIVKETIRDSFDWDDVKGETFYHVLGIN